MPQKRKSTLHLKAPGQRKKAPVPVRTGEAARSTKLDEVLQFNEEKFKFMFDHSVLGKSFTLPSGEIAINKAFSDMLGYSREELQDKTWLEITHPDDIPYNKAMIDLLISGKKDWVRFNKRYISKSGAIVWVDLHTTLRRDKAGRPLYFMTETSNITERVQAEEALKRSHTETTHANNLLLTLSRAAQAVQRARTPAEVYSAIEDQITELGYFATGFEKSADGEHLHLAYLNYRKDLVRKAEKATGLSRGDFHFRPRAGSIYQRAIAGGETVFVKDAAQAVADTIPIRLRSMARPIRDMFKLDQSIFAPLKIGSETIGVFSITGSDLTEADNPAVTAFACQAAIAIQNARLYDRVNQEMAERKQAEQRLQSLSTRQEAILAAVPDIIMEVDNNKYYTWANPAGMEFFGKDVIGKEAADYFEGEQETYNEVAPLFDGGAETIYIESWQRRKDGKKRLLAWLCRVLKDKDGVITGALSSAHDITERKRTEESLRDSMEYLRLVTDNMQDLVIRMDLEGIMLFASPSHKAVLGYEPEQLLGKSIYRFMHPDDIKGVSEFNQKCFQTRTPGKQECRYRHADGHYLWLESSGTIIFDENKAPVGAVLSSRDVTSRRQAEIALKESETRFRSIVENSEAGYFFIDKEGIIRDVNPAWVKLYRYDSRDEILGRHFTLIQKLDDLDMAREFVDGIMRGDSRYSTGEFSRKCKDGSIGYHSFSARPVSRSGQTIGIEGFIIDSTENRLSAEKLQESEARFHSLFDTMTEGVALHSIVFDEAGKPVNYRIVDANPGFEKILGLHKTEIVGKLATDAYGTSDPPYANEYFRVALQQEPYLFESYFPPMQKHFLISVAPWGKAGFATIFQDITSRTQAEAALHESEIRYRGLFENSPVALWEEDFSMVKRHLDKLRQQGVTDLREFFKKHPDEFADCLNEVKVLDVNLATLAMMRAKNKEQLIGTLRQIIRGDPESDFVDEFESIANGQTRFQWEGYNHTLDGEILMVSLRWSAAPGYEASLEKVLVSVMDITKPKKAEAALRASEEKLRLVTDNMQDLVIRTDLEGLIRYASPSNQTVLGYSPEILLGRSIYDFMHPDDIGRVREFTLASLQSQTPGKQELRYRHADGHYLWLESTGAIIFDENKNPTGAVMSSRDITGRKQTEGELQHYREHLEQMVADRTADLEREMGARARAVEALRESETKYRNLVDESNSIVLELDPHGTVVFINKHGLEYFGFAPEEILGHNLVGSIVPPVDSDGENLEQKMREVEQDPERFSSSENENVRKNGEKVWIAWTNKGIYSDKGQLIKTLSVGIDRTRQKEVEKQLARSNEILHLAQEKLVRQEKLAVLGQLAGGVGHELRNPLGVINTSVYYLKMVQPKAGEKVRQHLNMIGQEVHNADKIIADLLDFARVISPDRQPVSIQDLVRRTLERFPVPASVEVIQRFPADLPQGYADPLQMEQVLGNLTTNACQAMPAGGKLTISAMRKKNRLAIAVKDSGTGITPENMPKIFEPLFTTKVKGIGLGLAVSKKLAEANGARIEVLSKAGSGSTFTVFLPLDENQE